jgi:hypothetical protein
MPFSVGWISILFDVVLRLPYVQYQSSEVGLPETYDIRGTPRRIFSGLWCLKGGR